MKITNENLELQVTREGHDMPRRSPARSFAEAFVGFEGASFNRDVRRVAIVGVRDIENPVTKRTLSVEIPFVTFTRHGLQEFANGSRAWWESHR